MFRREMGSKRGSLPPKEGDLTCMKGHKVIKLGVNRNGFIQVLHATRATDKARKSVITH